MASSRHRATIVRVRKGSEKWIVFRADVGIFSSLLTKRPETDAIMFRDALMPVIKQELQVRDITLVVRYGDLFIPVPYHEITAKDLVLLT